ncbi:MAG: efflux RND transporter periplasmic adaptor subunit [Pyrinomonadaceae bacterium]|nr:efflux RND transporter periplasmic adaptor subunit [Pyrinomonadaceae bacterium]MCX7640445.1 efflux RND transporter periplasmic adaptor subunit [Pyrinomonadaceae bacterium]MDW8304872.1 efflux RND transporter periplasmic adaptor subunit [Acidobacteriota bacterium]
MNKRKIVIVTVVSILLLFLIIGAILATRQDIAEVTTVKVARKAKLVSTVTASGEVRPIQFINLTSEVQGRIEEIYVKEGDYVVKGQPLVRLDPTQLQYSTDAQFASLQAAQTEAQVARSQVLAAQNQLSQAREALTAAQASVDAAVQQVATARQQVVTAQTEVDRAQIEVNAARRELRRAEELLESNVISRSEYDQARDRLATAETALRNAEARLRSQQLAVSEAEARVKELRARVSQQEVAVRDAERAVKAADLNAESSAKRAEQQAALFRGQKSQRDKTLQLAPINGIIADIPSKVGTFAVAGLSTTPLLTIADMSTINVEVKVSETEIDKVEVGQRATIRVDAFPETEILGEVTQKTPLALGKSQTTGGLSTNINVQESKEFRVVIQLKEIPDKVKDGLRPGMNATATIFTKTVENVIAIPIQAIVEKQVETPTPQQAEEKTKPPKGVYIVERDRAKFVEVTTGVSGETEIEITSGLEEGQELITGPSKTLRTIKDGDFVKIKKGSNDS